MKFKNYGEEVFKFRIKYNNKFIEGIALTEDLNIDGDEFTYVNFTAPIRIPKDFKKRTKIEQIVIHFDLGYKKWLKFVAKEGLVERKSRDYEVIGWKLSLSFISKKSKWFENV